MAHFKLSIEDLAIDELERQEELARKTSSSHMLAFDIDQSSKLDEEAESTQSTDTQSVPDESTNQDVPVQDPGSESGQSVQDTTEDKPAQEPESQKAQEFKDRDDQKSQEPEAPVKSPKEAQVVSEAYRLPNPQIAKEYLTDEELGSKGVEFIKWLGMLGIKYGIAILKHVGSAVLHTAVHLVKFLFTSLGDLKDYISRRFDSYESLQHEIAALHNSVDDVKKDKTDDTFTDQKTIDHLKIGGSVDLSKNNKAFQAFMTQVMIAMTKSSLEDFTQTSNYIKQDIGKLNAKPSNILKLRELGSIVKPGTIEGYTDIPDNTHSLISTDVLPGDVKLILVVPVSGITDEEAYVKAYQQSYTALVADSSSFKHITSISFMSKSELKAYLADMNKLMLACIQHKVLFEQLMSSKLKLRFSFKTYLNQIFNSSEKLDVKSSLIELIYVKTIFAEKVYIRASMDMHDYAVRVLKANIKFAQANLKHLQ
jgi:predicted DNA-binding ArsR family transcriptional regulator